MRLRHIEVFHAVFVTGSVSGAAKSLNVSQPTVSKVLKHAEDQLGFHLFHREKGRLFPTKKGKLLFKEVLPVFEQINELRKYASMLSSTNMGRLRIAMTPAFSLEVVPKVLARFTKKNPGVSIEVETQHAHEITKLISNNTIDIGIAFEAIDVPGIKSTTIGRTEFVGISPTGIKIKKGRINPSEMQGHPFIRLNAKSPLGQLLSNKLEENLKLSSENSIVAETYHLAKRLVMQGAGVAIIDGITAYSGNSDGINFHMLTGFDPISIDIMTRADEPILSHKLRFIELLENELQNFALK